MARKDQANSLADLFPAAFRGLLTATGKEFIERTGADLVRQATLQVLLGHNVRTQTEPLTRQRIAEISGAIIAMFEQGRRIDAMFYSRLSQLALNQLRHGQGSRAATWPAKWVLGLTGKGFQNVLRSDHGAVSAFLDTLERALSQAAVNLQNALGPLQILIGINNPASPGRALGWSEALRLTTALGCAELAIRGSDKSRYGKLFERLVLGSVLSILGFSLSERRAGIGDRKSVV